MLNAVSPIIRADLSGNANKGDRQDVPNRKKQQEKSPADNTSTINILFPDVMRALIEEQAHMEPIMLQNISKNFFREATVKYETREQVIKDPLVAKHHLQNILT